MRDHLGIVLVQLILRTMCVVVRNNNEPAAPKVSYDYIMMIRLIPNKNFTKYLSVRLLMVCGILLSVPTVATDMDLKRGLDAYQQKNYSNALKYLKPLAEKGNSEAQRKLGVMYRHGLGVKKNDSVAIGWYRKAAQGGHVRAQNSLGIMYRFGLGVQKNLKEAVHWLTAAAEQGDGKGQENIGLMYLNGDGVQQNDAKAAKWLQKSAEQGHAKAQLSLGLLTLAGRGIKKNQFQGMDWIQKAANRGYRPASEAMAKAYAEGLYGKVKDIEKAHYWYKRAGKKLQ